MLGHEHGYFWNSQDHDRIYNADSFSEWLRYFFTTGVFFGTCYVQADRGMDVIMQKGYCNVEGKVRIFDQDIPLTVSPAHASLPRIDSVVVERNDTERTFKVFIVEGTPANSPVAPVPVRGNGIYQLVAAQISVRAGATAITQSAIKDTRGDDNLCPYVAGTLRPAVWEQVVNQWTDFYNDFRTSKYGDFDAWFQSIKGQLSTDAAGNLQNQINFITNRSSLPTAGTIVSTASGSNMLHTFNATQAIAIGDIIAVEGRFGTGVNYYMLKANRAFSSTGVSQHTGARTENFNTVVLPALGFEMLYMLPGDATFEAINQKFEELTLGNMVVGKAEYAPTNEWKSLGVRHGFEQVVFPEDAKELWFSFYLYGPSVKYGDNETPIHVVVDDIYSSNVHVFTGGYYYSEKYYATFAMDVRGHAFALRQDWTRVCDGGVFQDPAHTVRYRVYYR